MPEDIQIPTADGVVLSATLFAPENPVGCVLFASAMGVPRGFYKRFASALATRGLAALTVDYRGVGDSPAVPGATLADWADRDLMAAVGHLRSRFGPLPLHFVGHSVGGQLLGLMEDVGVERALFVASQSGYWRHWDGLWRARMWALWHGIIPVTDRLLGKLPAQILGGGDSIPGGVASQWARWGRDPDYIMGFARQRSASGFSTARARIRALAFTDDAMAPRRAVEALAGGFEAAEVEVVSIDPRDVGLASIGHFGAFRRDAVATLWPSMVDWLCSDT